MATLDADINHCFKSQWPQSDVVTYRYVFFVTPSLDMSYSFKNHIFAHMFQRNLLGEKKKKTGSLYLLNISIGAHVCPSVTDVIFYKNHLGCWYSLGDSC